MFSPWRGTAARKARARSRYGSEKGVRWAWRHLGTGEARNSREREASGPQLSHATRRVQVLGNQNHKLSTCIHHAQSLSSIAEAGPRKHWKTDRVQPPLEESVDHSHTLATSMNRCPRPVLDIEIWFRPDTCVCLPSHQPASSQNAMPNACLLLLQ
jgi:hypothetical protein